MSDESLISITNVTKRYGRKRVLRGIDLKVGQGEVMALLERTIAKTIDLRAMQLDEGEYDIIRRPK